MVSTKVGSMFYIYDIYFNMEYINIFIYWEVSTCRFLRDVNTLLTTSDSNIFGQPTYQRMPNFDKLIIATIDAHNNLHAFNGDACGQEDSNKVARDYLG